MKHRHAGGLKESTPEAGGKRSGLALRWGLHSLGARKQISIAFTLITVIPLLSLTILRLGPKDTLESTLSVAIITVTTGACIMVGFFLLARLALNIEAIRRYLEGVVGGAWPEEIQLAGGMSDVPAIAKALRIIVEQMRNRAERAETEVRHIGTMLARGGEDGNGNGHVRNFERFPDNDDDGLVMRCIGRQVFEELVEDCVAPVGTSAALYEVEGERLLVCAESAWCQVAMRSGDSKSMCGSCHCEGWREGGRQCVALGATLERSSPCGMTCVFVPIMVRGTAVGATALTVSAPPRDGATITALAVQHGVSDATLREASLTYEPRHPLVVKLALRRLATIASLVGQIVEHNMLEGELRKDRDLLEDAVQKRTSELEEINLRLQREVADRTLAEGLKDEFVSTVSHELRTPLAITREGIELLLDGIPGPVTEKQTKVLKSAKGNVDRLARIINDLLDISKIEAGKMVLNKERTDLLAVATGVVGSMELVAAKKGLLLTIEAGAGPYLIFADSDRMVQVLTNLISNAIKFTDSGSVTLSLTHEGERVCCRIRDTGIGLTEAEMPKVFEKFIQFGRTHGAGQKGTGLGLPISKHIVELHNA